ncbi:hypothetical protein, partial [Frankia sp. Cj5]|uniref:hypothetical protein n=1 Tax=Frankia sp. Cj5 TaxID=2880978 RepID=UPI001EF551C3
EAPAIGVWIKERGWGACIARRRMGCGEMHAAAHPSPRPGCPPLRVPVLQTRRWGRTTALLALRGAAGEIFMPKAAACQHETYMR